MIWSHDPPASSAFVCVLNGPSIRRLPRWDCCDSAYPFRAEEARLAPQVPMWVGGSPCLIWPWLQQSTGT